jgi:methylphosphotriester-DNA--protein-cysteine methyltransferase
VTIAYAEQRPVRALAPYVEALWWMSGRAPASPAPPEKALPDGCLELVLHLGDPFAAGPEAGRLERQAPAVLVGQLTRCLFLRPGPRVESMGIRFRPGGALPFLGPRLHELTARATPLRDLWGPAARELEETVAAARGRRAQARAAQGWLGRRLASRPETDRPVAAAVRAIVARKGAVTVAELAGAAGLSPRQLERRFRAAVGVPPKALARVLRFQAVLHAVGMGAGGWAGLALDHGYFDQPHLIRDFQELAGESPARLLARLGELGRRFVAPERLAALFAPGEDALD